MFNCNETCDFSAKTVTNHPLISSILPRSLSQHSEEASLAPWGWGPHQGGSGVSDMTGWLQTWAGGAVGCRPEGNPNQGSLWFSSQRPKPQALQPLFPVRWSPLDTQTHTDCSLFSPMGLQAALEMLLLRKPVRLKCHPLANYHYAGRLPGALCPIVSWERAVCMFDCVDF